jgi:hypothetical protein
VFPRRLVPVLTGPFTQSTERMMFARGVPSSVMVHATGRDVVSNQTMVTEFRSSHAKLQTARDTALQVSLFCIITAFAFLVAVSITTVPPGAVLDDFPIALSP